MGAGGSGSATDRHDDVATDGSSRTVHLRTCPLCEAMCALEVRVAGTQVELIRPIGAVIAYVGNPLAHGLSLSRYAGVLIGLSGIPMIYSPGTVDQWPKNVGAHLMYGGMWTIPVPDLRRTDLPVIMRANPHASQGSLLACPDVMGEIDAIRARGGEVIVIDPRRTGTADRADEWLPIVPGTDAALLAAVVHLLFEDDRVDLGAAAPVVDGVGNLAVLLAQWTPERVAPVTGVAAARIRRLARQLSDVERGVLYGRIALC